MTTNAQILHFVSSYLCIRRMSKHSKWAKIKRKKGVADVKRGATFTKLTNNVTIADKECGGGDPTMNFKLRLAVDAARTQNVPKENIERAIKRGTGEIGGVALEEVAYGAFGAGGSVFLITAVTDNKNRTLAEIKKILLDHNAKFAELNSIQWMFRREGANWVVNGPIKIKDENIKKELESLGEALDDQQEIIEIYDNIGD